MLGTSGALYTRGEQGNYRCVHLKQSQFCHHFLILTFFHKTKNGEDNQWGLGLSSLKYHESDHFVVFQLKSCDSFVWETDQKIKWLLTESHDINVQCSLAYSWERYSLINKQFFFYSIFFFGESDLYNELVNLVHKKGLIDKKNRKGELFGRVQVSCFRIT